MDNPSAAESLQLDPHAEGAIVAVKAQPGARQDALRGLHGGMLKIAVRQVAEKGKANDAVCGVLAQALGIAPSRVVLVGGATQTRKRLLIRGLSVGQIRERLAMALAQGRAG